MYKNIVNGEAAKLLGEDYHKFVPYATLKFIEEVLFSSKEKRIEDWDLFISDSQLINPPGAHSRENILQNMERFMQIQTLEQDGEYNLDLPVLTKGSILDLVSAICGTSSSLNLLEGQNWVSLDAFKEGMHLATRAAKKVLDKPGDILLATGHPKSLVPVYAYIGKCLANKGFKIHTLPIYTLDEEDTWLSSISGVHTVMKFGSLEHSHSDCGLDNILKKENTKIDLAIVDHGLAGATIRMGIPTIAIVDTNDIEIIIACSKYTDRVFPIPMHDNAGFEDSMVMAYYFEYLMEQR